MVATASFSEAVALEYTRQAEDEGRNTERYMSLSAGECVLLLENDSGWAYILKEGNLTGWVPQQYRQSERECITNESSALLLRGD